MVAMVFKCVSGVFSSVSEACFNCLQTYVTTVVFGCFKSRSNVASLLPTFAASSLPEPARHLYDAAARSFQIGATARPSPLALLSLGRCGPRMQHETGAVLHGAAGAYEDGAAGGWQRERA
jgi:hypothetical protein